jgi:hypothetical protein
MSPDSIVGSVRSVLSLHSLRSVRSRTADGTEVYGSSGSRVGDKNSESTVNINRSSDDDAHNKQWNSVTVSGNNDQVALQDFERADGANRVREGFATMYE